MSKRDNPFALLLILVVTFCFSASGIIFAYQFGFGLNSQVENKSLTQDDKQSEKSSISSSPISTPISNPVSTRLPAANGRLVSSTSVESSTYTQSPKSTSVSNGASSSTLKEKEKSDVKAKIVASKPKAETVAKKLKTAADISSFQFEEDIQFATSSSELTGADKKTLKLLAKKLVEYDPKSVGVRVIGHTHSYGDSIFNLELSQERASIVGDYLRSSGVNLNITSVGKGSSKPIPGADPKDRRNRRTEIILVRI